MMWWLRLCRRKKLEDQLESELRFHLDEHTADPMARGYSDERRLEYGSP